MNTMETATPAERVELGSFTFTAEDIVHFARVYDPQRFHLSNEEAQKTHFGRLCASGWHTAAVWMKLMIAYQKREAARASAEGATLPRLGPSPGFENLKWLKPVYAGDTITYFSTAVETRPSRSRPGWAILSMLNEGVNQNGEKVFSFEGRVFVEHRGKPAAAL